MKASICILIAACMASGLAPLEITPLRAGMDWKYKAELYGETVSTGPYLQAQGIRSLRIDSVSTDSARIAWVTVRDSGADVSFGRNKGFDQETRYRFSEDIAGFKMERLEGASPLLGPIPKYFYKEPIRSPDIVFSWRFDGKAFEFFRLIPNSLGENFPANRTYVCERSIGAIRLHESWGGRPASGGAVHQILIEHDGAAYDFTEALAAFDSSRLGSNPVPWEKLAAFPAQIAPYEVPTNNLGKIGNRLIFSGPYGTYMASLEPDRVVTDSTWERIPGIDDTVGSMTYNGSRLFKSSPSGIYVSDDFGKHWSHSHGGCPGSELKAFGDFIIALGPNPACVSENGGVDWKPLLLPWDYENYGMYWLAFSEPVLRAAGHGYLYKTLDYGETWGKIPYTVSASRGMKFNSSLIIGTAGTGLVISKDGGETWSLELIHENVHSSALVGDTVVAGTNSAVYLSPDRGESWININKGLPQEYPAGAVLALHYEAGYLYCATRSGAFRIPFRNIGIHVKRGHRLPGERPYRAGGIRWRRSGNRLVVEAPAGFERLEIRDLKGTLLAESKVGAGGGVAEFPVLRGSTLILRGLGGKGTSVHRALVPGGFR